MKLIYTPEGGEARTWEFRPKELTYPQAEAIEDLGFWDTFGDFGRAFQAGNRKALRAALWHFLRLENPKLKFDDLQPKIGELDADIGSAEIEAWREAVQNNPDLTDEQRAELLADIARQESTVDVPADVPEGKEPAGGGDTSSP